MSRGWCVFLQHTRRCCWMYRREKSVSVYAQRPTFHRLCPLLLTHISFEDLVFQSHRRHSSRSRDILTFWIYIVEGGGAWAIRFTLYLSINTGIYIRRRCLFKQISGFSIFFLFRPLTSFVPNVIMSIASATSRWDQNHGDVIERSKDPRKAGPVYLHTHKERIQRGQRERLCGSIEGRKVEQ